MYSHRGTLNIRVGPMFSGKSTWLNGELTELADQDFSVLKVIHNDDVRLDVETCDNSGSTHNSSYTKLTDKIDCIRASVLSGINVDNYHVIGVDEGQFFGEEMVSTIYDWVENKGKHVRVVGLDGDCFKKRFGHILDLVPFCDEIMKLRGRCKLCLEELKECDFKGNILSISGSFTKRLSESIEQKDVGGSAKYISVCRYHSQ